MFPLPCFVTVVRTCFIGVNFFGEGFVMPNKTMTTNQLVSGLHSKLDGITKKETKGFISHFLDIVERSVVKGHRVRLDGLGTLEVRNRKARMGRNPQTGEPLKIPASKKVAFRVSSALKEKVGAKKKR